MTTDMQSIDLEPTGPSGAARPAGLRATAVARLRRDPVSIFAFSLLVILVLAAVIGGPLAAHLTGHPPNQQFAGALATDGQPIGVMQRTYLASGQGHDPRYEMEVRFYDPAERIRLAFGSPYLRNSPTIVDIETGDVAGPATATSREVSSYETPFKLELIEFHRAITETAEPMTSGLDGLRDIALCRSVIACATSGAPVASPTALSASAAERLNCPDSPVL